MLYQLTYRSEAKPGIKAEDINAILQQSEANNPRDEITGCLVYNEGYFVQLLEGEKEVVKERFGIIELDDRHKRVEVLSEGETLDRMFEDWKMAYIKLPDEAVTKMESQVKADLKVLEDAAERPNFTSKVFWYNVYTLLEEKGFFRPQ
ncbi:BLUF domain-containing protein [Lentiprolixibacter aurantiacus]|uniref:BLUF domain-containing protein n=1 Tax=Lentiprolixibacter aurantiacus TaxID=2993939 RepID=A0AAE3MK84_9FLAO|nr:BLUF domain-containing protein [Lentiprolixibacter aurantiacus]MCX2719305.1 BLUF domain-containing protein [Lentiprolixibacter aurantiacus]